MVLQRHTTTRKYILHDFSEFGLYHKGLGMYRPPAEIREEMEKYFEKRGLKRAKIGKRTCEKYLGWEWDGKTLL